MKLFDRIIFRFNLAASLFIILMIALVYSNALDNEFTNWDDPALILNNMNIRSLNMDGIKTIFDLKAGGTYQPMRVFSYAIDYRIGGLNPRVFIVHNILLHMGSAVLLYFFLIQLLPRIHRGSSRDTILVPDMERISPHQWIALTAALLFALHPVNVESVTWLSSRKYVLLAFFSFLSLLFFIQDPVRKKTFFVCYAASFVFWLLAVMSSPFGVVLPALFILTAYCEYPHVNLWRFIREKTFLFLPYLALLSLVLSYLLMTLGARSRMVAFDTGIDIFFSMMQVFFDYLRNFLFPFWLNNRYVDYVYASFFEYYKVITGFVIMAGLLSGAVVRVFRYKDKWFFFVLCWFILCWLPASNIIPISTRMADRYVYLASVGFFVFLATVLFEGGRWIGAWLKLSIRVRKQLTAVLITAVLVFFGVLAVQRNNIWQNSGTLWDDSLKKDHRNLIAHNNYGKWLHTKGQVEKAKKHFLFATFLNPSDTMPLHNLGYLYFMLGDFDKAEHAFQKILTIEPDDMTAHRAMVDILNRTGRHSEAKRHIDFVLSAEPDTALGMIQKGLIYYEQKDYGRAAEFFQTALDTHPLDPELNFSFAMALQALKSNDNALLYFSKAIDIKPDFALAHDHMGQVYFAENQYEKAMAEYETALSINSGLAEIHNDIGNVFLAQNQYEKAGVSYEKAVSLNPKMFEPRFNQCLIAEYQGRETDAIECYQTLMDDFPQQPEPFNNVGSVYLKAGNHKEAEQFFRKALGIDSDFHPALYNLSRLYIILRQPAKALIHFEKFFKSEFESGVKVDMDTVSGLCSLLGDDGYSGEAVKCYQTLLENAPNRPLDIFKLGIVLLQTGQEKSATDRFQQAYEMDPDNAYFGQFMTSGDSSGDIKNNTK